MIMALNTEFLEEMRTKLLEEKGGLESSLNRFAKPTEVAGDYKTTFEDIGPDADENASEVEMYADNIALEDNLEGQLAEVDAALARMEAGTYGVCRVCGKDIEDGRLRAFPAADDCMEHAK
jgi:RNA polymerase-binding transcription factor DksA